MRIAHAPRREPPESIVPMINVVFLLLIFFLMTAQITPPAPFEVAPPEVAEGPPVEGELTLYLSAGGELAFREARGTEAALAALEAACAREGCGGGDGPPVVLRADAGLPGARLAALMPKLGALGIGVVQLVTAER